MSEQFMDAGLSEVPTRGEENRRLRRVPIRKVVIALVFGFIAWVFYCTARQLGWYPALSVIYIGLAIFYVIGLIYTNLFKRLGAWPALALGIAFFWILWVGSYNLARDVISLCAIFVATMILFQPSRRWMRSLWWCIYEFLKDSVKNLTFPPKLNFLSYLATLRPLERLCGFKVFVTFLGLFWCVSSGLNALDIGRPLKHDENRLAALRQDTPWKGTRVGLALSGGGYRAALMHAGVLDAFEKLDVPVTHMASVSGGSIISSFYAAGGKPEDLRDAVIAGRFNLTRKVTDVQNALRLPFPWRVPGSEVQLFPWYSFARSEVQVNLLDMVLLNGVKLADLRRVRGAPRLMICATDLCSGAALGITEQGLLRKSVPQPSDRDEFLKLPGPLNVEQPAFFPARDGEFPRAESLARLVTASGAFPGAFSALPTEIDFDGEGGDTAKKLLLADGGITDNTALTLMLLANKQVPDWRMDIIFASDASALFNEQSDFTSISELSRAIDIVYANVGVKSYGATVPRVLLSPATILAPGQLPRHQERDELRNQVFYRIDMAFANPDRQALLLVVGSMPDGERKERITRLLKSVREQPESDGQVCFLPSQELTLLKNLLADDLFECLDTFLRASTLSDRFSRRDAVNLYRLGQYVTALDWPLIKQSLDEAGRRRLNPTTELSETVGGVAGGGRH